MRIVHVVNYYQSQIGYQESNLAKVHKKMGHEVHIITSDRYFPFPNFEKSVGKVLGKRIQGTGIVDEDGVTVHRLPCFFEYPRAAFIFLRGLNKKLKEIKPDFVCSHGLLTPSSYFTAKNKKTLGYRLVYDVHAAFHNTNVQGSLLKRIYLWFWRLFIRSHVLKNADKVVAVGPEERKMASFILGVGEDTIEFISLGADIHLFRPDAHLREKTRKELNILDDEILFVHAGKLSRNKKVENCIKAFQDLSERHSKLKMLIIGGGDKDYEEELKKLAVSVENKIIWMGFVPNKDLPGYFNAADIGVWPGNPSNIIQEAVASGLPVVLRRDPTTDFLVQAPDSKQNGFIFDPGDERGLVGALEKLVEDADLRKEMAELGRKNAETCFSWEIIGERFLAI